MIYEHYEGGKYMFIDYAEHIETGENLVIYKSLVDDKIWARPKDMFFGKLIVDGKTINRFKPLN